MGRNFYAHVNVCNHCNKADEIFHIGKSSFGWTFSFRGYTQDWESPNQRPITSYEDWVKFLIKPNVQIIDEYGTVISFHEFLNIVESKKHEKLNQVDYCREHHPHRGDRDWKDKQGNAFYDGEFS